jgi:hypothetical protein
MTESSSSIIEQPSREELLAIWHQRAPWKSREENEEDFDSLPERWASRYNGWKIF